MATTTQASQTKSEDPKEIAQRAANAALAVRTRQDVQTSAKWGEGGIELSNLAEAKAFALEIAESGLAPQGMNKPGAILLAMQKGQELGLKPLQALQSIVVVNGRTSVMGTTAVALIERSGLLEPGTRVEFGCRAATPEERKVRGDWIGFCRTTRAGDRERLTEFDVEDAKAAGLWGKRGPWTEYPKRMLPWRAVGFHARDYWSDILHGMMVTEEARDVTPRAAQDGPRIVEPRAAAPDPLFDMGAAQAAAQDAEIIEADVVEEEPEVEIDPETGEVVPDWVGREEGEA